MDRLIFSILVMVMCSPTKAEPVKKEFYFAHKTELNACEQKGVNYNNDFYVCSGKLAESEGFWVTITHGETGEKIRLPNARFGIVISGSGVEQSIVYNPECEIEATYTYVAEEYALHPLN